MAAQEPWKARLFFCGSRPESDDFQRTCQQPPAGMLARRALTSLSPLAWTAGRESWEIEPPILSRAYLERSKHSAPDCAQGRPNQDVMRYCPRTVIDAWRHPRYTTCGFGSASLLHHVMPDVRQAAEKTSLCSHPYVCWSEFTDSLGLGSRALVSVDWYTVAARNRGPFILTSAHETATRHAQVNQHKKKITALPQAHIRPLNKPCLNSFRQFAGNHS